MKQPSKRQTIVLDTIQSHKHLSSADVAARRDTLTHDLEAVDTNIARLKTLLSEAVSRQKRLEAIVEGLSAVLGAR